MLITISNYLLILKQKEENYHIMSDTEEEELS